MRWIVDTSVAVRIRDGDAAMAGRLATLEAAPMLSILSRVELEGGVYRDASQTQRLRSRLDAMLRMMEQLSFGVAEAVIYGRIVEQLGYSRPQIIDRMIAAQAISVGATLATLNIRDFKSIAGLQAEDWSR